VPVDANVERVVARLFAIDEPLPGARKAIRQAARSIWPGDGASGDFAQAMMDLGSSLCTSRTPACLTCPLSAHCKARDLGIAADLPIKPVKRARPIRQGRAWWIERNGDVWLVRRPDKGMLGGMRALPGDEWLDITGAPPCNSSGIGTVRHVFTHFELYLTVERREAFAHAVGEGEWWPIARLDEAGLPTLYRRAAEIAVEESV
jgi:A/G-specific adenine glycosylase